MKNELKSETLPKRSQITHKTDNKESQEIQTNKIGLKKQKKYCKVSKKRKKKWIMPQMKTSKKN